MDWRAFVPTDTADHLATMDRAARQSGCGVPWQLLAAIARVESDFGRNMATSSAGAIGYGQFLPSSWQAFGSDGNAYDYRDALPAIAQYLCRAGLARDPRRALFAYNHADWYVDLVLDLAVRYDRMAPGAPVPEVLSVGPAAEPVHPLHYAVATPTPLWLTVPWRGRKAGAPISPASLASTTLEMLRGTFGLSGGLPDDAMPESSELGELANRAWPAGLLALPEQAAEWTVDGIRLHLQRGQPVVALLDGRALPGHPASDGSGDQPVVVIGTTTDELIYADPSFSSSLGYGLVLADADFLASWRAATLPRRALAFTSRPRPQARQAHMHDAEPPPVIPRLTATPRPPPTLSPSPLPTVQPTPSAVAVVLQTSVAMPPPNTDDEADSSWVILAAAGALLVVTFLFRRRRAHR